MALKLQTTVKVPPANALLSADTVFAGIGSCFSQNILQRFFDCGFAGAQNPNGIVYNACSIADALRDVATGYETRPEDLFEHNGRWHSWTHHGHFSDPDVEVAVAGINEKRQQFRAVVERCNIFVMTPSSSAVYVHKQSGRIVANCHKVPNHLFERRLLSVDENRQALTQAIDSVRSLNKSCQIVLTLSPVRHYPGDLLLNSRSKAALLSAIEQCQGDCPEIQYFPSYEIVLDELRDYRFYKEDMMHVSPLTEQIILDRFVNTYFDEDAKDKLSTGWRAVKSQAHVKMR